VSIFRSRIILHLDTGLTIEGVLTRRRVGWWTLDAVRVEQGGKMVDAAGPAVVPRKRIVWAQKAAG
jgi:hypothetical protein